MTKVYLVTMHECKEGIVIRNGRTIVDEVFTNKRLAIAFVNRMNKIYWKYEKKWYWAWDTKIICKLDYTKFPNLPY